MRPCRGMGKMSEKKLKKLKEGGEVKKIPKTVLGIRGKKGGLYENIQKKRARIKAGSGETMRKPGSKGAPTAMAFEQAAKTAKKK